MPVEAPIEVGSKYIEIVVEPSGETSIEVHGCTDGQTCRAATAGVEQAIGRVDSRDDKKHPDAHQTIRKA